MAIFFGENILKEKTCLFNVVGAWYYELIPELNSFQPNLKKGWKSNRRRTAKSLRSGDCDHS
jgi:hypothetical protein